MGQPDLFPKSAPALAKLDTTPVTIPLHLHMPMRDKAWLLSKRGKPKEAQWVPKAICIQDDKNPTLFTLPRHEALKRGWL